MHAKFFGLIGQESRGFERRICGKNKQCKQKKSYAFLQHGVEVLIQSTHWIDRMRVANLHRDIFATKIAIRARTSEDNPTGQVQGPEFDTAIVTSRNKDSVPDAHKRSDSVPVTMQGANILSLVRIPQTNRPEAHTMSEFSCPCRRLGN